MRRSASAGEGRAQPATSCGAGVLRPRLRDALRDRELDLQGYTVLPFLSREQAAALLRAFEADRSEPRTDCYVTSHSPDLVLRRRMSELIERAFAAPLTSFFADAAIVAGTFVLKSAGSSTRVPMHQDWSMTDERRWRGCGIWVALVDTRDANGALCVVPGSHLWLDAPRGPGIPSPIAMATDLLWERRTVLELEAGQAVIHDLALFHGSGPNRTRRERTAAVAVTLPRGAEMRHYCGCDGGIQVYRSDPDFYRTGDPLAGAAGLEPLGALDRPIRALHDGWLAEKLGP